jgi:hypothetical protein
VYGVVPWLSWLFWLFPAAAAAACKITQQFLSSKFIMGQWAQQALQHYDLGRVLEAHRLRRPPLGWPWPDHEVAQHGGERVQRLQEHRCQILPLPISRYRFKFQSNLVWDSIKSISNFCFQF